MYGYVVPNKSKLSDAEFLYYRSHYCGICKATGKLYGQFPRFTTNYDIAFLSVLLHDYLVYDVAFETGKCILNPIKKKATICKSELLEKIIAANIILSYYKMIDGVRDKEGFKKKVAKRFLTKAYNKAKVIMPKIDELVSTKYEALFALERENSSQIDRVTDCFASLLEEVAKEILGVKTCDNILKLCYNIGKFVYLIDALDDIDEDFKKKRYNPFLAYFSSYQFKTRQQFFTDKKEELEFMLAVVVNRAAECFNQIIFTQASSLLTNIVHKGMRDKIEEVLSSKRKLKKARI
ncbi:MAG: DUF5685 family protein [Firmicutes bacterium]|nr:DUF5685 family protein [Bacillota bacterium]